MVAAFFSISDGWFRLWFGIFTWVLAKKHSKTRFQMSTTNTNQLVTFLAPKLFAVDFLSSELQLHDFRRLIYVFKWNLQEQSRKYTTNAKKKLFHCVNSNMAYQRFELAAFLLNNPNQMTQTTRFYSANKMSNSHDVKFCFISLRKYENTRKRYADNEEIRSTMHRIDEWASKAMRDASRRSIVLSNGLLFRLASHRQCEPILTATHGIPMHTTSNVVRIQFRKAAECRTGKHGIWLRMLFEVSKVHLPLSLWQFCISKTFQWLLHSQVEALLVLEVCMYLNSP